MSAGFRILERTRKVNEQDVKNFAAIPVANISDSMARMSAAGARLRPLHRGGKLAGPALTVKSRPGDNLMVHKALDLAEPGDIVVVDAGGDLSNAIIGELMVAHAIQRGLGGIVIHGAVRDVDAIQSGSFPVFAAGVTHRGPYKDGPGEINVAIAIDGMVIAPGDLVVGDSDGLLCVAYEDVAAVYAAAKAKNDAEAAQMAAIRAGSTDRGWIDAALLRLGCEGGDQARVHHG
ncbi:MULTISPECIES: RraA family protein [Herbaspirillum]|uniref:RraA family protein n=1 Tax=Herbaspirillum TaxID=963 RepID=UPI00258DB594|nr:MULTISPECIES: RraA family protein [Herbaspirillum]MCP3656879.1 RraA family protein [Herbaspirillum sp.]MCP3946294.1 RraA family protein [Herbaspirillum sp.]MCP4033459.1 RraA family protein [Herbaspirillum sp.]MCP4557468.1 RraA family protein [Herbaspirillum sp.]MEE1638990.1 RraA family protein [Herbaspirillum huttiense NC40101]